MLCGHAEDDVVEYAGVAQAEGLLHGVDPVDRVGLLEILNDVLGILGSAHDNADGVDAPVIDDEDAVFFEEVGIAKSLEALEGDEDICLSLFHDGFGHVLAVAHESDDAAAALCHAVDFRNLHFISGVLHDAAQNAAGEQGSLPADADDHNILCHNILHSH